MCVCVCVCAKSLQLSLTLFDPHGLYPARLLCPCGSQGKNTRVGCHSFLQGIFRPSEPGFERTSLAAPALQAGSLLLSHQESPE